MSETTHNQDDKELGVDASGDVATGSSDLPTWFAPWARELAELYFSGTTTSFVLHGNTFDFVQISGGHTPRFGTLADFLAEQMFGRWDLVLYFDLARGLRCLAGRNQQRLKDMVSLANRRVGDLSTIPKDPTKTLAILDRFVMKNIMADPKNRVSAAIIIDHASYLMPRGERGGNLSTSRHLVTMLNWATSPYVKRLNMAFISIEPQMAHLSERLTGNPHVVTIEVPLPEKAERLRFLKVAVGDRDVNTFSDYGVAELAELTAGVSLTDTNVMVQSGIETGRRLDEGWFKDLKKRLIERQAQGLLEFIEPKWGLDMVVGHEAAKKRLREDAELLKRGQLDSVPMGYLLCGPVGTGKSFLAVCSAGAIGIPCVKLKNFRSKYVGETEGNLERVLTVLRSMGPVLVMIDEADAMLGDRDSGGESGVNSRIFGMIASQMGDTRYRGRILWMLMTARPDLLPVDIKRQGRAEVHVPLFYPHDATELTKLFVVLARKVGAKLAEEDVPDVPHKGDLSGADIEGIIGRAWRASLLAGHDHITRDILAETVDGFMPSSQTLEREMQELAAIIECTDREFLPPHISEKLTAIGGREKMQERFTNVRRIVESM